MFKVLKKLEFCYGHRLMDYQGKCAHPHGHNGTVEIEFTKETLDSRGMVIDFVDIKKEVQRFLDEELDHRMILRKDDPLTGILQEMKEPVYILEENPTAENLARVIFNFARERGLPVNSVRLWETANSFAEYGKGEN